MLERLPLIAAATILSAGACSTVEVVHAVLAGNTCRVHLAREVRITSDRKHVNITSSYVKDTNSQTYTLNYTQAEAIWIK